MTTGWPQRPVIYEVNTAVWLEELTRAAGTPVTLGSVTDDAWDAVTPSGVDAVWLMGVWERSPAGLEPGVSQRADPQPSGRRSAANREQTGS